VDQEESIDEDELAYRQAKYPIELDFADPDPNDLVAARKAIRREFRDAAKWKRLRCRKVRMVSESESGSIFELEIGHAVEFDWTWEGAVAFRPLLLKEFEQDQADMYQHGSLDPDVDDSIVWSGEVLEVDEATGRIFIVVATPEFPPRCGSFYVRPFEFLAFLDAVFNEPSFEVNIPNLLKNTMMPRLQGLGVELSIQTNKPFERGGNMLLATTSHSFKGYDSEVVIIVGVDQFKAQNTGILSNNLYVAMTRARSVLTLFSQSMNDPNAKKLYSVIEDCLGYLGEAPSVAFEISPQDDIVEILDLIGSEHRKWLIDLWSKVKVSQEPLMTKAGEVIAEPMFSFRLGKQSYACFGNELPRKRIMQRLEDFGLKTIVAGESISNMAE
jgi:hypothetical protein